MAGFFITMGAIKQDVTNSSPFRQINNNQHWILVYFTVGTEILLKMAGFLTNILGKECRMVLV
jgi:hypothetical protein